MRVFVRRLGYGVAALSIFMLAAGCGPSTTKVTGKILRDGKPLPVSATGVVQVILVPDVAPGTASNSYVGRCDSEGKFEILDVKIGKYKIAIEHLDPTPQTDKLEGAFSESKTTIIREIDGKKAIEIDLAHP